MLDLLLLIAGAFVGLGLGYLLRKTLARANYASLEAKAEQLLKDAKVKEQEFLIKARDMALKIVEDAKREEQTRLADVRASQERIIKREEQLDSKIADIEDKQKELLEKREVIDAQAKHTEELAANVRAELEHVAKLTREEAQAKLTEQVEQDTAEAILSRKRKIELEGIEPYETKARNLIALAMQRCAHSQVADVTTSTVQLPSDEMKGRIIGKEGRNIKTLEMLTGVEIVVDETPQTIMLTSFNAIRRQVAKRAIEWLMSDGRIHPARIEEAVERAKKELALEIKKAGEDALYELGITGVDPKLVQLLGRLKFRTSYSQNVLLHSMEVARVSAMLAEEIGADVNVCKKGGIFHDIGKAVDHDVQGGHPEIGYNIMKKFGFEEAIAYQCIAHHEDMPKTLEGVIVKVGDAVSGGRPGARRDTYERYLQRLEDLEKVAKTFEGIDQVYAIQAGREVRVFVRPETVSDLAALGLARDIAKKIEGELQYPGEIKVTLIREQRIIEYAR